MCPESANPWLPQAGHGSGELKQHSATCLVATNSSAQASPPLRPETRPFPCSRVHLRADSSVTKEWGSDWDLGGD